MKYSQGNAPRAATSGAPNAGGPLKRLLPVSTGIYVKNATGKRTSSVIAVSPPGSARKSRSLRSQVIKKCLMCVPGAKRQNIKPAKQKRPGRFEASLAFPKLYSSVYGCRVNCMSLVFW